MAKICPLYLNKTPLGHNEYEAEYPGNLVTHQNINQGTQDLQTCQE